MSGPYRIIVTDTSPLFTLVLADSLDMLLRPGLPVSIPDAVYIEATRVRGAPGADRIVEWINDHLDKVRIIPTDIGIDQQRRLEEGRSIRGLGEQPRSRRWSDFSAPTQRRGRFCFSRTPTSSGAAPSLTNGSISSALAIFCESLKRPV